MNAKEHSYTQSSTQHKLTHRRRCRSETLPQMDSVVTVVGLPIELEEPNSLRSQSIHHQSAFRHHIYSKFNSPNTVLRNQDSTKNIFSLRENHRNPTTIPARMNSSVAQSKITNTKENFSFVYDDIDGRNDNDYKEFCLRDNCLNIKKHQRTDCEDVEVLTTTRNILDTHKRRVRSRSESEPHEIYLTKSSPSKIDRSSAERENLVLKRSREDKLYIHKNGYADTFIPTGQISSSSDVNQKLSSKSAKNLQYTKIVNNYSKNRPSTICTPRYSNGKSLNGNIRKLRSKNLKSKSPTMVVANSVQTTCSKSTKTDEESKDEYEDDSDGGDGSVEDDVNIEGVDDDNLDDSLSDLEENVTISTEPNNINQKLSTTNLLCESVIGSQAGRGPLTASLFPHVPPYITFADYNEKGPPMPEAISKALKWKLSTVTPIIIRKVLINTGFRLMRKTNDWMGVWGKHMKSSNFKTVRSYQKINHIPGSFQIGRKDQIWRNLQTLIARHGKSEFGFMPRTFIIPSDLVQLHRLWPAYSNRHAKWIIKPPASARGTGIKVVNQWSQIPKRKPLIVQRYVDRPFLIDGSKFDLRLYVLVTSVNPLRVYMHTDGLARFASVKYSSKSDTLNDRYMHLTNYSINKLSQNYAKNEDANACRGHKWTLKSLWTHLSAQGINTELLWAALRNLVLRTILCGEHAINHLSKTNVGSKYNTYELFGIDVILNSELIPWLLEVNVSPSLHSASPLDVHVKGPLVQAVLNTVMYQIPPRIPVSQQHEIMNELGLTGLLCHDKRIYTSNLSKNDKWKHNHFTNRNITCREEYIDEILKSLTPDDIRCLLLTEDELARSAPLERIFPSKVTHKYLQYIESPRYYNRLLDAWEHRYGGNERPKGIALIRKFCEDKIHLVVPTPVKKDSSESSINPVVSETKVQQPQPKLNGTNNIEATITTVNNGHITTDEKSIFDYFNGHGHHVVVNSGILTATD